MYFIVCSDDQHHVRVTWPADLRSRTHFVSGNAREVDMALLTLVDHAVISTGSFGWWAAYLRGASGSFRDWSEYLPSGPARPLSPEGRPWHSTCTHPPLESAALLSPQLRPETNPNPNHKADLTAARRRIALLYNEAGSTFYYASAAESGTLYHKLYFAHAHDYFPPAWIGLTDAMVSALDSAALPPDQTLVDRVRASVSGAQRAAHSPDAVGSGPAEDAAAEGVANAGVGPLIRDNVTSRANLLLRTSLPISVILLANRTGIL